MIAPNIEKDRAVFISTLNDDCERVTLKSQFVRPLTNGEFLEKTHFNCVILSGGEEVFANSNNFLTDDVLYEKGA